MVDRHELTSAQFDENIKTILLDFYDDKQVKILELLILKKIQIII